MGLYPLWLKLFHSQKVNNLAILPAVSKLIGKFFPLSEPMRMQDLLNTLGMFMHQEWNKVWLFL